MQKGGGGEVFSGEGGIYNEGRWGAACQNSRGEELWKVTSGAGTAFIAGDEGAAVRRERGDLFEGKGEAADQKSAAS